MSDSLYQDQLDLAGRLQADEYFADVPVLVQRKGVTDSDIEIALSTLNTKAGKMGALLVVLLPALEPDSPEAPGPRYRIVATVQVIEQPLLNLGADGIGKSAEQLAERVRQLLHHAAFGRGAVWAFSGMEPVEQGEGKIAYGVRLTRLAGDGSTGRLPTPTITATSGLPTTATLACADAAAAIWYTLDGSYPWAGNTTATQYTVPVAVSASATLRAVAYRTGYTASNLSTLTLT